jgi:hypothetical protein
MSKYCKDCKDCKHSKEESDLNTDMFTIGLLLHFSLFIDEDKLKCDNHESIFYCDDVDEYDSCSNFESK